MTNRQAVRAIVRNNDMILAMRRDKFGMQYYTLVGGGVDLGEDAETALRRELREETGLEVGAIRLVFIEDGGDLYGVQYVYLCEYRGGEPQLSPSSEEALTSAAGKNIYEPLWLPLSDIQRVSFRSSSVRDAMLSGIQKGFPETPQTLAWKA
jgi:ADP-ribose pyrophosphatase YjhB (NUDIX family)